MWAQGLQSVIVLALAACSTTGTSTSSSTAPIRPANRSVAVGGGYGGRENFCADAPLKGQILYDGTGGYAALSLSVAGLPPNRLVGLNWQNNDVRGYLIASFQTGPTGRSRQSTLRVFRPGEVRGIGLVLTGSGDQAPVLGRLAPCLPVE